MKFANTAAVLGLLLFQLGSSAGVLHSDNPLLSSGVPASHWILQFKEFPGAGVRRELARRGIRVLEYVPESALIVSFHQSPDLTGLNISWTGQLTPADRTAPGLGTAPAFLVAFHGDVLRAEAESLLGGFQILPAPGLPPNQFLVAANLRRLPELATLDRVSYIRPAPRSGEPTP
jgi:hypothetical protein